MPLNPEDLQYIAERTLAHYEQHAQSYWEGTRDHDVSQNIEALLQHMPGPPPFDLLDFGCGPGRDLHTFKALGHRAVGLEGAPSAAALARAHSGCEVLEQSFLQLELPAQRYDGVFANAVLFHVPRKGAAPGTATTACLPAAGRRAVQFQPARRWPGGLER